MGGWGRFAKDFTNAALARMAPSLSWWSVRKSILAQTIVEPFSFETPKKTARSRVIFRHERSEWLKANGSESSFARRRGFFGNVIYHMLAISLQLRLAYAFGFTTPQCLKLLFVVYWPIQLYPSYTGYPLVICYGVPLKPWPLKQSVLPLKRMDLFYCYAEFTRGYRFVGFKTPSTKVIDYLP